MSDSSKKMHVKVYQTGGSEEEKNITVPVDYSYYEHEEIVVSTAVKESEIRERQIRVPVTNSNNEVSIETVVLKEPYIRDKKEAKHE